MNSVFLAPFRLLSRILTRSGLSWHIFQLVLSSEVTGVSVNCEMTYLGLQIVKLLIGLHLAALIDHFSVPPATNHSELIWSCQIQDKFKITSRLAYTKDNASVL